MASKRRLRHRRCENKRRHVTVGETLVALHRLQSRGHKGKLAVYRCNFCNGYHVGHAPGHNGIGSGWAGW
jgi:hypothetical protein